MARRLTQKQKTFCLKYFELRNATEAALVAGYSPKNARRIASENLTKLDIKRRLDELNKVVEDATVATVLERKQILTEILRVRPADIMEISEDERDTRIKAEALKSPAVSYIRTEQIALGKMPVRVTRVGLIDKVRATTELNKMERIYETEGGTLIDNRTLIINVISDKARSLTQRLINGERVGGDNDN